MERDHREFTASALCYVAGCELETFKAWRRRNGLFASRKKAGTWSRFTGAEICAAKLVVDLTKAGVAAQRAVDIAMKLLPTIKRYRNSLPNELYPGWENLSAAERGVMASSINFVVKGTAAGGFALSRYDKPMTVSELLFLERDPAGIILINLENVFDLSIDRLQRVWSCDISDNPAPPKKRAKR